MPAGRKQLIPFAFAAVLALAPAASAAGATGAEGRAGFWAAEAWPWLARVLEVFGVPVGAGGDPNGENPAVGVGGDPNGAAPLGWSFVGLGVGVSGDPDGGEVAPPPRAPASNLNSPGSDLDDH
jgi:hypothetical protein